MSFSRCLAILLVFAYLVLLPSLSVSEDDSVRTRFEEWVTKHSRQYKDENEKEQRFKIYKFNFMHINNHNAKNVSYKLADNCFADLSNLEFRSFYLGFGTNNSLCDTLEQTTFSASSSTSIVQEAMGLNDLPERIDWKEKGAVTPIADQGQCGSCWAFSAVEAIESIHQIKTGKLVTLSKQELVDCDTEYDQGCSGGFMSNAFEFAIKNHGLTSESDYPYTGDQASCQTNKLSSHVANITGYKNVTRNSESSLLEAVAGQPVSVAIDASDLNFQLYSSGIFSGPCQTNLNHGVVVVGYDSEDGKKYWIVKNSWGILWGDEGYMKMERETGNAGLCGINMLPSYPII